MPAIITLTTDFGTRDGFVGQMKGVILSINPDVMLVDVTHEVEPFSVLHGALVLRGISNRFPEGSIHLAVVDPGVGSDRRGMVLRVNNQIFVGPDNGLFSFITSREAPWEAREIQNSRFTFHNPHPTFHGRDVFAPVAAHLSRGAELDAVGPPLTEPIRLHLPVPEIAPDGLTGQVIHIDRFGNLSTNIEAGMLDRPVETVSVKDTVIYGLSRFFSEVAPGEPTALINSFGLLEIALNGADAARTMGIGVNDPVRIEFE